MNKTRVIILGMTFMLMIITFLNAETLLSDAGVEYESEILDVFNANNQTELRVGIELKDKSGINITGTKEERRTQLRQIDEWFQPKIERLLADYSNDSSIIFSSRMLNGFVAIVNKEGFDKLANDYRISKIFLDKPIHLGLSSSVPFINADDVQNLGYNGTGVNVCIIDTGVNASHSALFGKIINEYCYNSSFGDCTSAIAVNWYENVNNISWGSVNDSSDPYVINNYIIGIKGVITKFLYYNESINNTCTEFGCDNNYELDWPNLEGTLIATNAPNIADVEMALSWNTTSNYWCTTWTPKFNSFIPNYGSSNPIYVLNCFADNDCSSGNYCNKTGNWSTWSCVAKKSNGQSCTSGSQCSSNYCDNDGIGLGDDNWCFTPYNSYFDGQETSYCEVSTDVGIVECDERQVGDDYEFCDTGNKTYFADQCSSICGGEDRGDNICRSSAFATGCIADAECNGIIAGNGNCTISCFYVPDTHKYSIKNSSGSIVAWLGNKGNIVLKGKCFSGGSCNVPGSNSFIVANATDSHVAFINSTGDLCIEKGDCSDQSGSCNPMRNAFIVRNSSGTNMSYIDYDGELCLTGRLYENAL